MKTMVRSNTLTIVHPDAELRWGCFRDRAAAGAELARELEEYAGPDTVVIALPRGGLAVGDPFARGLGADFDVLVSRKIGAPGRPELAIGAVAEGGAIHWNEDVLAALEVRKDERLAELARSRRELDRRAADVRAILPRVEVADKTVLLTDDGVATGATLRAAIVGLADRRPAHLVVALPGGPQDTLEEIARLPGVDGVVALLAPEPFYAVGQLYEEFGQVGEAEVERILRSAAERRLLIAASREHRASR